MQELQRRLDRQALFAVPSAERVGVLFVHGVGSQRQSATVREFGEPLLAWLREWHKSHDDRRWWNAQHTQRIHGFRVLWSHLSYGTSADEPAGFAVHIPPFHIAPDRELPSQTWVVTEAWWASRLEAPPFSTMTGWALRSYRRAVMRLLRGTLRRLEEDEPAATAPPGWVRFVESVSTLLLALGYAVVALLGFIPLLVLLLLSRLPIPGAAPVLLGLVQSLLVDNVGDFYTFVYDPIQALHMRSAVREAVTWLIEGAGCQRVVVMGHSQGTVVALDALASGDLDPARLAQISRLVTVGAALNNAWDEQRDAQRVDGKIPRRIPRSPGPVRWLDLWAAYDYVAGGPIDREKNEPGPDELRVTNELNVVTDHGGYFQNHEEYTARLAREIDRADDHKLSRFYLGDAEQDARVKRRRLRVAILVSLRLLAMLAFGAAVLARYLFLGQDLESDGLAIWSLASSLPFVGGLASAVGSALTGLGALLVATTRALFASPPSGLATAGQLVLDLARVLPQVILVLLALGIPFGIVYVLGINVYFVPWHQLESIASAQPAPWEELDRRVLRRALGVLLLVAAAGITVALLPPVSEVAGAISRAMGGS